MSKKHPLQQKCWGAFFFFFNYFIRKKEGGNKSGKGII